MWSFLAFSASCAAAAAPATPATVTPLALAFFLRPCGQAGRGLRGSTVREQGLWNQVC